MGNTTARRPLLPISLHARARRRLGAVAAFALLAAGLSGCDVGNDDGDGGSDDGGSIDGSADLDGQPDSIGPDAAPAVGDRRCSSDGLGVEEWDRSGWGSAVPCGVASHCEDHGDAQSVSCICDRGSLRCDLEGHVEVCCLSTSSPIVDLTDGTAVCAGDADDSRYFPATRTLTVLSSGGPISCASPAGVARYCGVSSSCEMVGDTDVLCACTASGGCVALDCGTETLSVTVACGITGEPVYTLCEK